MLIGKYEIEDKFYNNLKRCWWCRRWCVSWDDEYCNYSVMFNVWWL